MNKAESNNSHTVGSRRRRDACERGWQEHWRKVGRPGYELSAGCSGSDERDFLAVARTPQSERAWPKRINNEFDRAIWKFREVATLIQCRPTCGSGWCRSDASPVYLCS
jgi:hypothetical protein